MLTNTSEGRWDVTTKTQTFAINEADEHTQVMLHELRTDPSALEYFEALLEQVGAAQAYAAYNDLPAEAEEKGEAQLLDEKAQAFAALIATDPKAAYYALQGLEMPRAEGPIDLEGGIL